MSALFVSDLHLCAERPRVTELFERFLSGPARSTGALYILGDLFEYWAGDDDLVEPFNTRITLAIKSLSKNGVHVFFMRGNRDFLAGEAFADAAGLTLLDDPVRIDLPDGPVILSHGDALCTDDADYQAFRARVRDPAWMQAFLARPLADRKAEIESMRAQSQAVKRVKSAEIMDVAPQAVSEFFRTHAVPRLIHGHTHRPARHEHRVDGHLHERWVLADWHDTTRFIESNATGLHERHYP